MNKKTGSWDRHLADSHLADRVLPDRILGEHVSMGEPYRLNGDENLRNEIESSLEILARQRLTEADEQAKACIQKAKTKAEEILAGATTQSAQMIADAESQVAGIVDNARETGFKTGFQEGFQDASNQVSQETVDLLKAAQTLLDGAYEAEKQVLKGFSDHAMALIHQVANRILCREMTDNSETLMALIQQAVDSLYLSGKVQVVVSPLILQDLRNYSDETRHGMDGLNRFEFVPDAGLGREQIYIISQEGSFDISPLSQANQLLSTVEGDLDLSEVQILE